MKKEKYYWKVVCKQNNTFTSAIIKRGHCCLTYKIGEVVTTCFQGIFVFTTREQARQFKKAEETWDRPFSILKVKFFL